MTDLELVDAFIDLFEGRTDAYGTWTGGLTLIGGEPRTDPMVDHLYEGPYIGVYCTTDDNHTRWGCVDIDGKDFLDPFSGLTGETPQPDWTLMWQTAANLQDALAYKDITTWLERTANGIHLWVFTTSPVPAATMRRALLVACEVAEYQPKEVNPKQEQVNVDKPYGNYVRLPYYGALVHGTPKDRFVVDEDGVPMRFQQFIMSAQATRVEEWQLQELADLWVPPAPKVEHTFNTAETEEAFRFLEPILPRVVQLIFEEGPLNGDRSSAMVKTALILRDEGWQAQAVFTVLSALDNKLGKFVDRPDRDERLADIITKVGL